MEIKTVTQITFKKTIEVDEDSLLDILCRHFKVDATKTTMQFNVRQGFCDGVVLEHKVTTYEDDADAKL